MSWRVRNEKSKRIEGFGGEGAGMSRVCVDSRAESGSLYVEVLGVLGTLIAESSTCSIEPRMVVVVRVRGEGDEGIHLAMHGFC